MVYDNVMTTTESTLARDRANAGVIFLNRNVEDWRQAVDLGQLDMSDSDDCVFGQIARKAMADYCYNDAMSHFDLAGQDMIDLGFEYDPEEDYTYGDLNDVWRNILAAV